MTKSNTFSRRGFLEAVAALSSLGVAACAAGPQQTAKMSDADRKAGKLPSRGEFVVRNGSLVAVGPNLSAPGAEEIDGRIASPCPASSTPISIFGAALRAGSWPMETSIIFP
jgi:hypothetical protein